MEVLPEASAAQEVGCQVGEDHQQRVEEHPALVWTGCPLRLSSQQLHAFIGVEPAALNDL